MNWYDFSNPADPTLFFLEIESMVAWPGDPEARARFLCTVAGVQAEIHLQQLAAARDDASAEEGRRRLQAWERLYDSSGGRDTLLQVILKPPGRGNIIDEFWKALHHAYLAGLVLHAFLQLAEDPRTAAIASLNEAKKFVRLDLRNLLPMAQRIPGSERPVDDAWNTHKCIAPLIGAAWATRFEILKTGDGPRSNRLPLDVTNREVRRLLRHATAAERMILETPSKGTGRPILDRNDLRPLPFRFEESLGERITYQAMPDDIVEDIASRQTMVQRRRISGLRTR